MLPWLGCSINAFGCNDGGHLGLDSLLSFSVASNHLRFTAPRLSVRSEEALIVSCEHTHTHTKHFNLHTYIYMWAHVNIFEKTHAYHFRCHIYAHMCLYVLTLTQTHAVIHSFIVFAPCRSFVVAEWKSSPHPVIPPVITQHTYRKHTVSCHQHFVDIIKASYSEVRNSRH